MLLKTLDTITSFEAGDATWLKEVLHPDNDALDLAYSIAYAIIKPQKQSLPHQLKNAEVYLFLNGTGEIVVNEKAKPVQQGSIVYVPPMATQHVVNKGEEDLAFYCIVSPAWKEEEEFVD